MQNVETKVDRQLYIGILPGTKTRKGFVKWSLGIEIMTVKRLRSSDPALTPPRLQLKAKYPQPRKRKLPKYARLPTNAKSENGK